MLAGTRDGNVVATRGGAGQVELGEERGAALECDLRCVDRIASRRVA